MIIEDLSKLCNAAGCAGQDTIAQTAIDLLRPFVDEIQQDSLGNVIGFRHADVSDAPTVMLEAHLDEIGFLVTHIDERGFVFIGNAGGIDRRVLAAQKVIIYGKEPVFGVFSSVPPHLSHGENKLPEISDIAIDAGLSANDAKELIPLGSRVGFTPNFTLLNDDVVSSKALDNRSGMAAILHCLKQLTNRRVNVGVAFCVQEELGCRGSAVAARQINPDYAIVTDVSFALTKDADARCCGEMNKGVMIGISPILNEKMQCELCDLAASNNIPYQYEVMAETTGTDADSISTVGFGVKTALLSIPLRYMHTPVETVSIKDITAVGDLMAAFINEKGAT